MFIVIQIKENKTVIKLHAFLYTFFNIAKTSFFYIKYMIEKYKFLIN